MLHLCQDDMCEFVYHSTMYCCFSGTTPRDMLTRCAHEYVEAVQDSIKRAKSDNQVTPYVGMSIRLGLS